MFSNLINHLGNLFNSRSNRRRTVRFVRRADELESRQLLTLVLMDSATGSLYVNGSQDDDQFRFTQEDDDTVIISKLDQQGDWTEWQTRTGVHQIFLNAGAGNDLVINDTQIVSVMHGGDGNDELRGGSADDVLIGGMGDDILYGEDGNDLLIGAAQDDDLFGGDGDDSLYGGWGRDMLSGESDSDRLFPHYAEQDSNDTQRTDEWAEYIGDYNVWTLAEADRELQTANGDRNQLTYGDVVSNDLRDAILDESVLTPEQGYSLLADLMMVQPVADVASGGNGNDYLEAASPGDDDFQLMSYLQGDDGADELIQSGGAFTVLDGGDNDYNWNPPAEVNSFNDLNSIDISQTDRLSNEYGVPSLLFGGNGTDITYGSLWGHSIMLGGNDSDLMFGSDGLGTAYDEDGSQMFGGNDDDVMIGSSADDTMVGGSGNDIILGRGGDDQIWGDPSQDIIDHGSGVTWLNGVASDVEFAGGTLSIRGSWISDRIVVSQLSAGAVRVSLSEVWGEVVFEYDFTGVSFIEIDGGPGGNVIFNNTNIPSYIIGGPGNDIVFGGSANDIIDGGDGDDSLHGRDGADQITGGEGNDSLHADSVDWRDDEVSLYGNSNVFNATAAELDAILTNSLDFLGLIDILDGGNGMDYLYGDDDTDLLLGGNDYDRIEGGDGADILLADELLNSPFSGIRPEEVSFDNHLGGGGGDDYIFGSRGNDIISGGSGNDVISGSDGDDLIRGEEGDDTIQGGSGDDEIHAGSGNDEIHGGIGNDDLYGGWSTPHDDADTNVLFGGSGHDLLVSYAGHDVFDGGAGDDWLQGTQNTTGTGGDGLDYLNVGTATDENELLDAVMQLWDDEGTDPIEHWQASRDAAIGTPGGTLLSMTTMMNGNAADDKSATNPTVTNGVLTLTLDDSGQHVELVQTRESVNIIYFDKNGKVTIQEAFHKVTSLEVNGGKGNDRVVNKTGLFAVIRGGDGDDVLIGGSGRDVIYGGSGNDVLMGNGGRDSLYGDRGNDLLDGGLDGLQDELCGGDDKDTFVIDYETVLTKNVKITTQVKNESDLSDSPEFVSPRYAR